MELSEIDKVEVVSLEFGQALMEATSESESRGEITTGEALKIYLRLSEWQRKTQELVSLVRERGLL
jgi:hypothetical protein